MMIHVDNCKKMEIMQLIYSFKVERFYKCTTLFSYWNTSPNYQHLLRTYLHLISWNRLVCQQSHHSGHHLWDGKAMKNTFQFQQSWKLWGKKRYFHLHWPVCTVNQQPQLNWKLNTWKMTICMVFKDFWGITN